MQFDNIVFFQQETTSSTSFDWLNVKLTIYQKWNEGNIILKILFMVIATLGQIQYDN